MNVPADPLVSIVIPVYNGDNYLREAIVSALAQTYPRVEVIVVNDGSTDGGRTREVATSFGDRVRYFEQANGGVATALNLGIREMRGSYFSWLSHDDVYYPDKVAREVAFLTTLGDRRAIPFGDVHVVDESTRVTDTTSIDEATRNDSILLVMGAHINGCTLLIPQDAFETAGVFNESLRNCQDNELWLRMVLKGYQLTYMPEILVQSRSHPAQGSQVLAERHAQESRVFYHWALGYLEAHGRLGDAAGLFRILLAKRLPSVAWRLFAILHRNRKTGFALSSLIRAASDLGGSALRSRLRRLPGARRLKQSVTGSGFRSSSDFWQRRYQRGGTSGVGSYGKYAAYKADVLNAFVATHNISRVAEIGCGDGNQLRGFAFAHYLGLDVSSAAVEQCRKLYRDDPTRQFLVITGADAIETAKQFRPELVISLDVIYHLVEDSIFEDHIASLFNLSSRYVIVYSTNFERRYDSPHQVDRKFTAYVEARVRGWRLVDVLPNPHKGRETQSDFYVYERILT